MLHAQGPPLTKVFLSYLRFEKALSENTISSYATDLARLTHFAYQAQRPIESLKAADLRKFIAELSREGLSPATIRRIASAVRSFYLFLALDGYIDDTPTDDLDTPPPVTYLPTFLNEAEVHQLLIAPDPNTNDGIRDRAPTQANRTFATLRKLFSWAVEHDLLASSPCLGLRKPAE